MRALLGIGLLLGLTCAVTAADEKIDAKKLVGKWEPKKAEKGGTFTVEFTKDGKIKFTRSMNGKELNFDGTYKVDGNKLIMTVKLGDQERTMTRTVSKLTDTELVSSDEKGKEDTLVRIKTKKK